MIFYRRLRPPVFLFPLSSGGLRGSALSFEDMRREALFGRERMPASIDRFEENVLFKGGFGPEFKGERS